MMIDFELLLAFGANLKRIQLGEVLFIEGENALFYHQLVEGRICCSNFSSDGREVLHEVVSPGDCFGELSVFDQGNYAYTATAQSYCEVLKLGINSFQKLLEEKPELNRIFFEMLSKKLRFKIFLLKELARHSPEETINALFKYFQLNNDNVCEACDKLLLTRQQIANLTGMRVETVIRATKSLEAQGIINIVKGKVFLNNLPCSTVKVCKLKFPLKGVN